MRHPEGYADEHAARREQKRRKKRYGMRTTGAGARLLARLMGQPTTSQAGKKRRLSRRKT